MFFTWWCAQSKCHPRRLWHRDILRVFQLEREEERKLRCILYKGQKWQRSMSHFSYDPVHFHFHPKMHMQYYWYAWNINTEHSLSQEQLKHYGTLNILYYKWLLQWFLRLCIMFFSVTWWAAFCCYSNSFVIVYNRGCEVGEVSIFSENMTTCGFIFNFKNENKRVKPGVFNSSPNLGLRFKTIKIYKYMMCCIRKWCGLLKV